MSASNRVTSGHGYLSISRSYEPIALHRVGGGEQKLGQSIELF